MKRQNEKDILDTCSGIPFPHIMHADNTIYNTKLMYEHIEWAFNNRTAVVAVVAAPAITLTIIL